ncbi:hypothetical protein AB0903_06580 [Streptomyces sp. NPDC048389]|uniref:hypothetical protein n=1 Tax=Streptomyces sp. NPDC048389 TaxID=3154622 RepID=UPI003454E801
MGSLRNPIGPLPSSIYWRRRAVAASLVALFAVLIVWAVSSAGGSGGTDGKGAGGTTPAPSITPGPDQSGPAISEQPGGRDESGAGGGDGSNDSGGSAGSGDAGGSGGSGGSSGSGGPGGSPGGTTDGASGGSAAGGAAGRPVPAGSTLPNCASGSLKLTLRSDKVAYEPGEKPVFRLVVTNSSSTACKADFGPRSAVFTVTDSEDETVWSTKDCPRPAGSRLLQVPARSTITHAVEWGRERSAPQCATPKGGAVGAGTYLLEATFPGATVLPASFRLEKD